MHTFEKELPTNYNENYLEKTHYLWKRCGDDKIIQKFIEIGESTDTMQARVGNGEPNGLNLKTRNSILSWLHYSDSKNKELYDFMLNRIDRINYWHFGFKLTGMESIQYTRYPVGGHYIFHNDIITKKENSMRKLSVVMSLTSAKDYEGGEFQLMPHGANPTIIKFDKGDMIAFPSWVPHKVNPVTSGNRITAVSWVTGPKFV